MERNGGPGPRWLIALLFSSPTLQCWWYLHLRVHQPQPGDLARGGSCNSGTHSSRLPSCHSTALGRWGRLVYNITHTLMVVTSLPVLPPARWPDTVRRGSWNSDSHSGSLASWYKTGAVGPAVHGITLMVVSSPPWTLCWQAAAMVRNGVGWRVFSIAYYWSSTTLLAASSPCVHAPALRETWTAIRGSCNSGVGCLLPLMNGPTRVYISSYFTSTHKSNGILITTSLCDQYQCW